MVAEIECPMNRSVLPCGAGGSSYPRTSGGPMVRPRPTRFRDVVLTSWDRGMSDRETDQTKKPAWEIAFHDVGKG